MRFIAGGAFQRDSKPSESKSLAPFIHRPAETFENEFLHCQLCLIEVLHSVLPKCTPCSKKQWRLSETE
jgi:hypothetical protein